MLFGQHTENILKEGEYSITVATGIIFWPDSKVSRKKTKHLAMSARKLKISVLAVSKSVI